jgi:hypothetical protein
MFRRETAKLLQIGLSSRSSTELGRSFLSGPSLSPDLTQGWGQGGFPVRDQKTYSFQRFIAAEFYARIARPIKQQRGLIGHSGVVGH